MGRLRGSYPLTSGGLSHRPGTAAGTAAGRALRGWCPACGKGRCFRGLTEFVDACPSCGIRLGSANVGDGASWFIMLVVGALATGGAFALDAWLRPPVWVHAMVWTPVILGATVGLLRPVRALLLASHVRHDLLDDDRKPDVG